MSINHRLLLFFGFVALCLAPFAVAAQSADSGCDVSQYPYIVKDSNCLKFDTASASMRSFFQKWYDVDKHQHGRISIMHIGGSHVQAGTMTHRIRMNLLKSTPAADRGMIFPYSAAAKCNNPADYRVSCKEKVQLTRNVFKAPQKELGLCGIAVTAADSLAVIKIWNNEHSVDWQTNRIILFGYSPEQVLPLLQIAGREVYPSYVDSASHRFVFNLHAAVDSFAILLPCDSAQSFTLNGIYLGNQQSGLSYHSIGVNGAAVPDYLKCRYFVSDLKVVHPDAVVFGIGINDAAGPDFDTALFFRNYMRLCDSIRTVSPDCAFIFITNNDSFKRVKKGRYAVNRNGALAREVFYRLARATGGAVWDQFEIMGGLGSMDKWRIDKLAQNDRVHFTRAGYLLVGDLFSEALLKAYSQFKPDNSSPCFSEKPVKTPQRVKPIRKGSNLPTPPEYTQPESINPSNSESSLNAPYVSF